MRPSKSWWLVGALVVVSLLAAACTEDGQLPTTTSGGGEETTTTEAAETTTTEAAQPTTTEGGGSTETTTAAGEDSTFPIWIVIVAGIVVFGLLIWAVSRGGSKETAATSTAVAGAPSWKESAQASYSAARWLYDSLTEGLAIWRGNAQFSGTTAEGSTAETAHAATWGQLGDRMNQARDDLYALEAAAPDPNTAQVARSVVGALNATRSAVDARAEARYHYRTVEGGSADGRDQALVEARDREQRTAANLDSSRQSLGEALTALSSVA